MKNRTDRMLLRSFPVSLLAYGLLLSIYIQCFWSGTITIPILAALERPFFWLAVGGHGVPFFALQLLLCRRKSAGAVLLPVLTVIIPLMSLQGMFGVHGWGILTWTVLLRYSIAPAVGSLLACAVYGIHRLRKKKIAQPQGDFQFNL